MTAYNRRMVQQVAALTPDRRPRYLEPIAPVVFPEEELVPETQLHLELRTLLYQLLSDYLGVEATVGSDQFVYFDAADPRQSVAPDVYVRLAPRGAPVRSWKTWERGAPDVAVEVISDSDARDSNWAEKLARYRKLGIRELLRFDPEATDGPKLRIWDRVEGALVEREIAPGPIPSSVLGIHWVVARTEDLPYGLRIAEGSEGERVILTRAEARAAAEARIRELEALLKQRS
jgi:Uma2 family endonuclease